jgi:hypothetical protein
MRHPACGFSLAWLAALVIAFAAPLPVGADFVLSGPSAGDVKTVPDGRAAVPPLGSADLTSEAAPVVSGSVGYAITNEEFVGGVILLALTIGTAIYIGLHEYRDDE